MKTNIKRQEFLFPGKWVLPALVSALINLFALSVAFAETPGNARLLFLGNKNIAPVVYLDNATPAGVAVDIVQALAKHIPQPLEVRAMDWLEAQALVARGQADALIQINESEARKKIYDFSEPLLESQFSIFTSTGKVGISGLSSLRGMRVGVESGGLPRELLEKNPLVPLTIIPDFLAGFKLLNDGAIDAVVVDYRVGSYILAKNKLRNIKVSGEPIAFSYSCLAVRKGNTKLLAAINHALQTIKADGTYQKILDNWKPTEVVFETREQITHRAYYLAIVVLLVLLLIAVAWTMTLRKELVKRKAAEGLLGQQHSTLRSIINSANALIFSVDRHYRYTSFNLGYAAAMKALYGAEIELGHSLLDYMSVIGDQETARRNLDRALAGDQVVEESYSGEELRSRQYFQVSHSPVKTGEGIIGVAVLAQDMSERKRAEDALRRLNRELRAISNCNQILMRVEDEQTLLNEICCIICEQADYRMAWVGFAENDEAKAVRPVAWAGVEDGYLAQADITWADTERGRGPAGTAIRSAKSSCLQDFGSDPRAAPWHDSALQRGYRSCISLPLQDESQITFGALTIYSAEPDAFTPGEVRLLEELAGDLAFGITVLRTRNERKQAEEALRREQALLSRIMVTSPVGIAVVSRQGQITFANPQAESILGLSKQEITLRSYNAPEWHTTAVDGGPLRDDEHPFSRVMATRQPVFDAQHAIVWPDGHRVLLSINGAPIFDAQGEIEAVAFAIEDITERKLVEDALRFVAQRGWQTSGENFFFEALAQFLGEKLDMDYVLIDRLDENPDMAETVALYAKGAITPNMRYCLKGTPCELVMGRQLCVYPQGIQQLFPEDSLLPGMGVESFVGVPLWDSTGQPIGLIAVMSNKALPNGAPVTQLLQLVATRAAAELEREQSSRLLRASEHKFRTLAENLPDNIVRYDLEGRTVYVNPVIEETLGTDAARMLGTRIRELNPDGSYESYAQAVDAALASGNNGEIELTLPVSGKDPIVHQIRVIVERDEQGGVTGVVAIGRDITERKRAEQALRENEYFLDSLIEHIPIMVFVKDAVHLNFVRFNRAAEDLLGYSRNELIGKSDHDFFPKEQADFFASKDRAILDTREMLDITDETIDTKYLGRRHLHTRKIPILAGDGSPLYLLGISEDVTEHKLAEEQLRRSEHSLAEAQRIAKLGNWELDLVKNVLIWSDEIYRLFEIDPEKFGASYDAFLNAIHPDDRELTNKAYIDSVKNKVPYDIMHRLLMTDGRVKYVNERCETYYREDGKPLRSVGTIYDITERTKVEEELRRYKDHLEELVQQRTADLVLARNAAEAANRAKSVFLSSMSHELRTPLNAVLGFSGLMRKDPLLQAQQRDNLDIINRSGEHLLTLINDVLEMAKIEAGRAQLEITPFDLGSLVRDVTDMMHMRAQEKGLQLLIDQSSEFPRYIRGDAARVRQVLINLLGNAMKFTHHGGVTVRFGLKPHATPQRLLIEVEDSGIGISAADQKRVFEPFVQFGEIAAQQGTGLGLSIARQFVQLMGGTIGFESTLGKGSIFRVELPMERVALVNVAKPESTVKGEIVGLAPGQPEYRILIVEDQMDNQLLLTRLMKNVGFQVKVAQNGEQAVALFQSWRPQLIWMDRRMPVMDGLEATQRIRDLPHGREVKIVAVTASAFMEQREEVLMAGMDDFVRKPYRFNEIYECMVKQLGVQYCYAEAQQGQGVRDVVLTAEMLAVLPPNLRRELHDVIESLEGERITAAIGQVASFDFKLHKALSRLADNFDYPAILKALQTNPPEPVT
ncbi:MAG: PAS domain S-box protein [Rhodoferax sp.]|nr:PAS domain S-box protein [Rhodoferax sp.]